MKNFIKTAALVLFLGATVITFSSDIKTTTPHTMDLATLPAGIEPPPPTGGGHLA